MPERLVDQYGAEIPRRLAASIAAVHPGFAAISFLEDALRGYDELDLMARGRHLATCLGPRLPSDFPAAAGILVRSMGPPLRGTEGHGMAPFFYLPHSFYIAHHGLDHPEAALAAQYELTRRFTAEFCIRPFLERHPEATLARLATWAGDPDPHVRRLVSEGTRPRLPWAPRLRAFQADPAPVIALLEMLKDDPSEYVRRSVANNLNDIGKDNPEVLIALARRWLEDAGPERARLVRHALRSAVKRGDAGALGVLGYRTAARVSVRDAAIEPRRARIGSSVRISFHLGNSLRVPQDILVDLRVHFVKATGRASPKVFKLKALRLQAGQRVPVEKTLSLADRTTRKHYAGLHRVEALCNGRAIPLGAFELRD